MLEYLATHQDSDLLCLEIYHFNLMCKIGSLQDMVIPAIIMKTGFQLISPEKWETNPNAKWDSDPYATSNIGKELLQTYLMLQFGGGLMKKMAYSTRMF